MIVLSRSSEQVWQSPRWRLSTRQFYRSFGAWTDGTPTDWLIQNGFRRALAERVEQAGQLLLTGQYNVGEAAKLAGFTSSQALSSAFKSIHGRSPTKWLSQNLPTAK